MFFIHDIEKLLAAFPKEKAVNNSYNLGLLNCMTDITQYFQYKLSKVYMLATADRFDFGTRIGTGIDSSSNLKTTGTFESSSCSSPKCTG